MASIATRTGDEGQTGLVFGQRVSKSHPRIEAVGLVDELNAALGWAKASGAGPVIETIQRALVPLMGELSADDADQDRYLASDFAKLTPAMLAEIDASIAALENADPPLRFQGWATPGANPLAAALDLARVSARRAERHLVAILEAGHPVRPLVLQYINRVSDLLWLLARQAESGV